MKVLPGNPLGIGDPVLVAACIAAGGGAFVEHRQVGGPGACLERIQLLGLIHLEAQVVQAGFLASRRNGEVHPGLIQHPLRVVAFHAGGLGTKQLGIERDVLGQIVDVHMDMEAFHRGLRSAVAGQGIHRGACGALAAVFGKVGEQVVHRRKGRPVQHIAAQALLADQLGMGQLLEVERQRVGCDTQLFGQGAGRKPRRAGDYQGAENAQARFMGQGRKRSDDLGFLHASIIQL
ncbi:unnamed protein product, partial [Ilex paraguariensis]